MALESTLYGDSFGLADGTDSPVDEDSESCRDVDAKMPDDRF